MILYTYKLTYFYQLVKHIVIKNNAAATRKQAA